MAGYNFAQNIIGLKNSGGGGGGSQHHYSTEEQIVGTWVDGSTIYEKTYTGNDVSSFEILTANSWYETAIDVSFIHTFVGGDFIDNNNQYFPMAVARKSASQTMNISIPIANRNCNAIIVRYTKTTTE